MTISIGTLRRVYFKKQIKKKKILFKKTPPAHKVGEHNLWLFKVQVEV